MKINELEIKEIEITYQEKMDALEGLEDRIRRKKWVLKTLLLSFTVCSIAFIYEGIESLIDCFVLASIFGVIIVSVHSHVVCNKELKIIKDLKQKISEE